MPVKQPALPRKTAAWPYAAAAAALTFLFLSGVLKNGFVNWDDDFNLVLNPYYRGLGWAQLKWAFTTFHMGHYQPLSWLTLGADYLLWGMDPRGYHLTNLLLHAANAAVFCLVALRLLRLAAPEEPGEDDRSLPLAACFAALVFALHPLRVEAVAWATERRDVLSGLFYLLTALFYLKACSPGEDASRRPARLLAALVLYLLSLLSKGIGVSLPAALLILDIYPLRRLPAGGWFKPEARKVWAEKLPFAALALAAGATGLLAQVSTGATGFLNIGEAQPFWQRLLQAFYAAAFYLRKTLLPFNLSPLYERPYRTGALLLPAAFAALAIMGVKLYAWLGRRGRPGFAALWFYYLLTLLPVLQLVPFGPYVAADRYTYLACLPWALGAGWLFLRAASRAGLFGWPAWTAAALALFLGGLSARQVPVWRGPEDLWRAVLAVNPSSSIAHSNLGSVLLDTRGRMDEAAAHFREALRIRPDYAFAHYNLGNALAAQGRAAEALEQYRHTIRLMPDYANAWYNLGNGLFAAGDTAGAIENYRRAVSLRPDFADAHNNLGSALLRLRDYAGAEREYRAALAAAPGHPVAKGNLEGLLAKLGRKE